MNKLFWQHIICFCLVVSFSASALSASNNLQSISLVQNDSLQIDQTDVDRRQFDDLTEKYSDDDFVYEQTFNNAGWWTRFKQWLSDFFRDFFNIKNKGQASDITNIIINTGGIILFLLVVYFIFKAVVNKEGQWVFGKKSDKSIIPVTAIENNIHATNFQKLITKAEMSNNYRLAIRYYYLWLLKQLTELEIIEYDVEKTNSDYQNEIVSKKIKNEFSYTSYLYNYIWYGEFNVNQGEFGKAKQAFTKFFSTLKS